MAGERGSSAARALEVSRALAGALFSFVPFTANLLASFTRGAAERARVEEALATWDSAPEAAPAATSDARGGGRVLVVAGEPSGDRLAADVVAALRRRRPGVRVEAYGGPGLAAAGATLRRDLASDAVMGVTAVLRAAPGFLRLYAEFLRVLDEERPDVLLLVDYPGFNLRAAEAARRRGIPVVWYVVPQIWAWAPWRAARIGRAVDELLVVLPFERAFYASRGVEARYAGYPLFADRDAEAPDAALAARLREGGRPVLAVLPGSRRQEVRKNLPLLAAAAERLRGSVPGLRPVLACASPRLRPEVDRVLAGIGAGIEVLDGQVRTLLSVARAAACVSGTVTMECAHAGVPAVVVYRLGALRRALLRRVVTTPRVAMANLLAGREVYPEFFGRGGDADRIAAALGERLADGPVRREVERTLAELRRRLTVPGVAERVASVIEERLPA